MVDLVKGEWQFNDTTTTPPASGQVRFNNTVQNQVTKIYIHRMTATGVDASNYLAEVKKDQDIYLQDKDDSTKWQAYHINALPLAQTNNFEFPVVWARGGPNNIPQQRVLVAFEVGTSGGLGDESIYAFPSNTPQGLYLGLTRRQWYAGQALAGIFANPEAINMPRATLTTPGKGLATMCFAAADAMMQYEELESMGEKVPLAGQGRMRRA